MKDRRSLPVRILCLILFAGLGVVYFLKGVVGAQQGPTPSWIHYLLSAMWILIGIGNFSTAVRDSITFKCVSTILIFSLLGVVQYYEQQNWILLAIAAIFAIWVVWFYQPRDQAA